MDISIVSNESLARRLRRIARLAIGSSVHGPPLGSMTLDQDDMTLAKRLLKNKQQWYDPDLVSEYEHEFARWNGSSYAFAFMSGRESLTACIKALDLFPGDEVIIPAYTCVVVPNAFKYEGIKVVYCDIELESYGLDVAQVEAKISSKTKAILIQHLYGLVCRDYEALLELAQRHKLRVIEDCAHATGAVYKGTKVGNYGDIAFYSSEKSKVFNTVQGGMAVTRDDVIAERLREEYGAAPTATSQWIEQQLYNVILNYHQAKHPQGRWSSSVSELLYGSKRMISTSESEIKGVKPTHYGRRMCGAIAALGLNQLKKIDAYNKLRRESAKRWQNWCLENRYQPPHVIEDSTPVFLRYPVMVEEGRKRDTDWAEKSLGIRLGRWFEGCLHPVKKAIGGCPRASAAVNQCVNFPTILQ